MKIKQNIFKNNQIIVTNKIQNNKIKIFSKNFKYNGKIMRNSEIKSWNFYKITKKIFNNYLKKITNTTQLIMKNQKKN